MAAWDELPAAAGLGECAALVGSAEALRLSAPELAIQLARRALLGVSAGSATAGGVEPGVEHGIEHGVDRGDGRAAALSMRAHAVLAAGLVRVSHYVDAIEPAFAALALMEGGGTDELATSVRLDLAACSREVGEPLLGCAVLRPVLENSQLRPSVRAVALGRLVGCTAHVGRRDDVEDALTEADRLLAADDALSSDARRIERARLSVRAAAYHRWYGDTEDSIEAARHGLGQLGRLRGRRPETDRLRAQLVLELVCALLDEGQLAEAEAASVALLAEPVRATSASAIGQLMLAVSTRVLLPSGRVDRGRGLLDQAVWVADRHGLDGLLADASTVVAQLDERAGRLSEALESLRTARAAEQRRMRATAKAARRILAVVGAAADWDAQTGAALLRQVARPVVHPVSPVASIPARQSSGQASAQWRQRGGSAEAARPPRSDRQATLVGQSSRRHAAVSDPAEVTAAEVTGAETDEATGLLSRDGLFRRLRSVRNGERPVALTLVRLTEAGDNAGATGVDLSELAGRLRDIVPDGAELARSDGTELAVLLPHTTKDQAERFAEAIRQTAVESGWLGQANARSISTGVGQSAPDAQEVDADALLTAARHTLTPAEPARRQPGERTRPVHATARTAEALSELEDVGDTLRIGREIISSLSIPAGSGGKRRAETGTHPKLPTDPSTPDRDPGRSGEPADAPPGTASSPPAPPVSPHPSSAPAPEPAPADHHPTSGGHRASNSPPAAESMPEPPRPVGETGGYRPLISFHPTEEPTDSEPGHDRTATPRDPSDPTGEPGQRPPNDEAGGYRSSYEETRAELARLMSVLESGGSPTVPDSGPTAPGRPTAMGESRGPAGPAVPEQVASARSSTPTGTSAPGQPTTPDGPTTPAHAAPTDAPVAESSPGTDSPGPGTVGGTSGGHGTGQRPETSHEAITGSSPSVTRGDMGTDTGVSRDPDSGLGSAGGAHRDTAGGADRPADLGSAGGADWGADLGSAGGAGWGTHGGADGGARSGADGGARGDAQGGAHRGESGGTDRGGETPWSGSGAEARWSFGGRSGAAALPSPSHPGDDHPPPDLRLQSIPTPLDPNETPGRPSRRSDPPEFDRREAVPTAAPEPVSFTSDEPRPPPAAPDLVHGAAGRRERRGERSSDSSTIAGLLAEALEAYQQTSQDERDLRDRWADLAERAAQPPAATPGRTWERTSAETTFGASSDSPDRTSDQTSDRVGSDIPDQASARTSRHLPGREPGNGSRHGSPHGSRHGADQGAGGGSDQVSRHGAEQASEGVSDRASEWASEWASGRRSEGVSGSSQDEVPEEASAPPPRASERASWDQTSYNASDEIPSAFDRLFDWRYQAPSGRHRSPE